MGTNNILLYQHYVLRYDTVMHGDQHYLPPSTLCVVEDDTIHVNMELLATRISSQKPDSRCC